MKSKFFDHVTAFKTETYSPQLFLNKAARVLNCMNDSQLSQALQISQPTISNIRNGRSPISPRVLLRVIEATGWTVEQARAALRA